MSNSSLYSWGNGSNGQLGLGDESGKLEPTLISSDWKSVATKVNSVLGIKENGNLYSWGEVS